MRSQDAVKNVVGTYDSDNIFRGRNKKTDNHIRFGNVFNETIADEKNVSESAETVDNGLFSVGSSVDMMSVMFQMKEPSFPEELDTSIDLDSLEELDRIAEENAAPNITSIDDVFSAFGTDDDNISEEFGIEEIV